MIDPQHVYDTGVRRDTFMQKLSTRNRILFDDVRKYDPNPTADALKSCIYILHNR